MLSFLDGLRGTALPGVIFKLLFAVILGGAIGFERSYKNRPAGFRTHILVTLGAAVASLTGLYLVKDAGLTDDVTRLGAAVVAGLGFVGAIVTRSSSVRGLTTSAGLWASGIIGLAVGAGFFEGAFLAAVLILLTETVLSGLVRRIRRDPEFRLELLLGEKEALEEALRYCKDRRLNILELQVRSEKREDDLFRYRAGITLRPRFKAQKEKLLTSIRAIPGVLELTEEDLETFVF